MADAAMALQIGGVASQTFGSYFGAATQKANLYGQANTADANARMAELGAQDELARGQHQIGKLSLQAGQIKSSQRAAMAANGVDLGVGNAAEVQASGDLIKEQDIQTAQLNAIKAHGATAPKKPTMKTKLLPRAPVPKASAPYCKLAPRSSAGHPKWPRTGTPPRNLGRWTNNQISKRAPSTAAPKPSLTALA